MTGLFYTPAKRTSVLIYSLIIVALWPTLNILAWYNPETHSVYMPMGLDALTISIWFYLGLWLIFGAPTILLISLCLIKYPGRVPIFGLNKNRPIWTLAWSFVAVAFIAYWIFLLFTEPAQQATMFEPLYIISASLLVAYLRSAITYSTLGQQTRQEGTK